MKGFSEYGLWRFAVCLSLVFQLVAPAAMATSERLDWRDFICAPAGQVSDELLSAAKALVAAVEPEEGEEAPHDHCPSCVFAETAALAEPDIVSAPAILESARTPVLKAARRAYPTRGPPLGLRAPPLA
ncbi:MAG: DUF2946 family protein [Pseudomonadota bacterium]